MRCWSLLEMPSKRIKSVTVCFSDTVHSKFHILVRIAGERYPGVLCDAIEEIKTFQHIDDVRDYLVAHDIYLAYIDLEYLDIKRLRWLPTE